MNKKIFSSESVGRGHPDKVCDQISDAILDECLRQDENSRCAIECLITKDLLVISGEVTSKARLDYERIARGILKEVGYSSSSIDIDPEKCDVIVKIKEQSIDIFNGVSNRKDKTLGAGDQGIMFGYACNETSEYMPLSIVLAHELLRIAEEKRVSGEFKWAKSDMKSQVSIDVNTNKVDTILLSIQHEECYDEKDFKRYIKEKIIDKVISDRGLNRDYKVLINPSSRFVIGGPVGDCGLTGRKIVVDTYGGVGHHGGGAFSGKDYTKVDRSAAYMARYICKNLVASGLVEKCELQIGYAIGVPTPVSLYIDTFGTGKLPDYKILDIIQRTFDLSVDGIINTLALKKPIYKQTSYFGHFGRNDLDVAWEKLDKVEKIRKLALLD